MRRFIIIFVGIALAISVLLVALGVNNLIFDETKIDSKIIFQHSIFNNGDSGVVVQSRDGIDYFVGYTRYSYTVGGLPVGYVLWVVPKGDYVDISDFVNLNGVDGIFRTTANLSVVPSSWNTSNFFADFDSLEATVTAVDISSRGSVSIVANSTITFPFSFDYILRAFEQVSSVQLANRPLQRVDNVLDAFLDVFVNTPQWLFNYFNNLFRYVLGATY